MLILGLGSLYAHFIKLLSYSMYYQNLIIALEWLT